MREANRLAWGLGGHDSSNHNGGLGGAMDQSCRVEWWAQMETRRGIEGGDETSRAGGLGGRNGLGRDGGLRGRNASNRDRGVRGRDGLSRAGGGGGRDGSDLAGGLEDAADCVPGDWGGVMDEWL